MKSMETELRHIINSVMALALNRPGIYFQLLHNKKTLIDSPPAKSIRDCVSTILGLEPAKNMADINTEFMKGCVSRPGYQKKSRAMQYLYINGRHVKSKEFTDAVYRGYAGFLNVGRHPAFVLDITVDFNAVDVNVHPQKSAVRVAGAEMLCQQIEDAVRLALVRTKPEQAVPKTAELEMSLTDFKAAPVQESFAAQKKTRRYRLLGQVMKTYIVISMDGELLIIDQHAAQERVLYEKFMEQYSGGQVKVQDLIEPIGLELDPGESLLVESQLPLLEKLGYSIEPFGRNTFNVRTVPSVFGRLAGRDVLLGIIDELKTGRTTAIDKMTEERIIRKACRASVKANENLEPPELASLVDSLFAAKQPKTCPHGRPTMLKLTEADFEKMFRRRL